MKGEIAAIAVVGVSVVFFAILYIDGFRNWRRARQYRQAREVSRERVLNERASEERSAS